MVPINDENPTELTPWMTVLLIALNLYVWYAFQGLGSMQALEQSVAVFGTHPCEITGACPTRELGWEALFTSMFMHGGWGHILGNMLFLWVFGNNIEDSMGHIRFFFFYLACGLAAGLAHVVLSPMSDVPAVGASGAISGIMGAYIILYPRARVRTWIPPIFIVRLSAWFFLGVWFALQLLSGVALIKVFDRPRLVEAKRHGVKLPHDEVARLQW